MQRAKRKEEKALQSMKDARSTWAPKAEKQNVSKSRVTSILDELDEEDNDNDEREATPEPEEASGHMAAAQAAARLGIVAQPPPERRLREVGEKEVSEADRIRNLQSKAKTVIEIPKPKPNPKPLTMYFQFPPTKESLPPAAMLRITFMRFGELEKKSIQVWYGASRSSQIPT